MQQGRVQHGHAVRTYSKDMQHGEAAWTCGMGRGHADTQHEYEA